MNQVLAIDNRGSFIKKKFLKENEINVIITYNWLHTQCVDNVKQSLDKDNLYSNSLVARISAVALFKVKFKNHENN